MSTTKSVDRQLEIIKWLMNRQLNNGRNFEKTNDIYRQLIKIKVYENRI